MKIINTTRNTVLADHVIVADSAFSRLKGLLGKKRLENNHALILKPCNSIHTFFMAFSIDVLFIDKQNKVIEALSCIAPFRMSKIYIRSACVIELPAGSIKATSTSIADTLLFEGHL
jgi:uncharacterized membrane protein (UPF0127 family)